MIGLIPAAGKGKRFDWPTPKELWPIKQNIGVIPAIQYTLNNMLYADVDQFVVVTRHDKPDIMKYISRVYTVKPVSYVCQTNAFQNVKTPGFIDAIMAAYHLIKNDTVLFGMPDTIVEPADCFDQMIERYKSTKVDLLLGCFKTDTPHKAGMVDYSGDRIMVHDKPEKTNLEYMWGILLWTPAFTEYMHIQYMKGEHDYEKIFNSYPHRVGAVKIIDGKYHDIATIQDAVGY